MRMRRIPWAAEYLKESSSRIAQPDKLRGSWKETYPAKALHLEIGCGKGGYAYGMAELYPKEQFVAVEKNESAAGLAAKKFDTAGLDNLHLIYGDGADLTAWFAPGEVDVIHLNFSDPWPKKRNAKRRLSAPAFLEQYKTILSENGQLIMKTDNPDLFEYSVVSILDAGFVLDEMSVDFRRHEHPEDVMSEYERKFSAAGNPIYRAVYSLHKEKKRNHGKLNDD